MISAMEATSNTGPKSNGQSSRRVGFGEGLFSL